MFEAMFMQRNSLANRFIAGVILVGLAYTAHAQPEDEFAPDARFVAEIIGLEYCEVIPADMPVAEFTEGVAQMKSEGMPLIAAQLQGFMEGVDTGGSLFGTTETDTSFTAVHSLWGVLPDGRLATLCLHTLQIGDVPAGTGTFSLRGLDALAGAGNAAPGEVVMSGIVSTLEDTGNVNERGQRVLRQRTIGEVSVSGGEFSITAIESDTYTGSMRLQGEVQMDGVESSEALQIDAELNGMRALERVPTLTADGS